jgi:hypothetical protein
LSNAFISAGGEVPLAEAWTEISALPVAGPRQSDESDGALVVVIDDEPLVLEGMCGIFHS